MTAPAEATDFLNGDKLSKEPYEDTHNEFLERYASRLPGVLYTDGGVRHQVSHEISMTFGTDKIDQNMQNLIVRAVMYLIKAILKHQKGTLVTDPISYRKKIGVFVRGGTARDAAMALANLDPR